jgi:hypothetical protein
MKKVIRLTENDLIRLVKRVINEQTQPKEFKIGDVSYRIKNTTVLDNIGPWSKIEFVKLLPNGMEERKLNIGFVIVGEPKKIFRSKDNTSGVYGISDIDLVKTFGNTNKDRIIDVTEEFGKKFIVGSDTYQVKKITREISDSIFVDYDDFFKIGYYKVLPNGVVDNELKLGFILPRNKKFIYSTKSQNDNNKIGPTVFSTEEAFYIKQLKNGLSQIFKNEQIEFSNNVLSVGNKMKLTLSDNKIVKLSIPYVKTITKQTLYDENTQLNIKFVTLDINKLLSTIQSEFDKLIKKQNSKFKTTVKQQKRTTPRDVPYNGTQFKP